MKVFINSLSTLSLVIVMSACQSLPYQPYARDVKKKPAQGGIIALKATHQDEDQTKARLMMEKNCGNSGVKVLDEGEVAIGQEVKSASDTTKKDAMDGVSVGSLFGIPVTSGGRDAKDSTASTAVTTTLKEWQISYECTTPVKSKNK